MLIVAMNRLLIIHDVLHNHVTMKVIVRNDSYAGENVAQVICVGYFLRDMGACTLKLLAPQGALSRLAV